MKFNFKPFLGKNKKPIKYIGLYLGDRFLSFTKQFYINIGKPAFVNIGYDGKNEAIKIFSGEDYRFIKSKQANSQNFQYKIDVFNLANIMPKGRYHFIQEDDGFICQLEDSITA